MSQQDQILGHGFSTTWELNGQLQNIEPAEQQHECNETTQILLGAFKVNLGNTAEKNTFSLFIKQLFTQISLDFAFKTCVMNSTAFI